MSDGVTASPAQETSLALRRVRILLNPSAGSSGSGGGSELAEGIALAFQAHGIAADIAVVEAGEIGSAAVHAMRMWERGAIDAIVAGGGDGTISTVAGLLAGTACPLGVLPLGTLNHFARDLRIPLQVGEAIAAIASGTVRRIDVGDVNGKTFINNSSIGFYPYMVLDRERRRRHAGLPKWIALIPAVARTFYNLPLRRLSVTVAGRTDAHRSPCVFVGNNDYDLAGSSLVERDRLDRGRLSLHIAKSRSRRAALLLLLRMLFRSLDRSNDLESLAVAAVEIGTRRRRLLIALDGEIELMRTPLRYSIRTGALRVLVGPAS